MLLKSLKLSILLIVTAFFWTNHSLATGSSCNSTFADIDEAQKSFNRMVISLNVALDNLGLKAELTRRQAKWNSVKLSDPQLHDPNNFMYIVHSLNTMEVTDTKRIFGSDNERVNLIENPQRISEMPIISASLVSQEKPMTYGMGIGLILKVPSNSIFSTREVDLQSNQVRDLLGSNPDLAADKIIQKYKKYGLDSPQKLLSSTPNDFYNEILLTGRTPEGQKVEVVGYFVKAINGMNMVELMGNMGALTDLAQKNNLPILILNSNNINIDRLKQYEEWQ